MAGTGTVAPAPKFTAYDNNGAPLSGGKLYVYEAGTSTPATTYSDVDLATANANPVVLDAGGRASVFLSPGSYKFLQKTSADVTVWTQDNVSSVAPFNVDLDVEIVAGEALTIGQAIYLSDGTGSRTAGRWYLTDADTAAYSTLVITGFVTTALALGETGSARLLGEATVPGPLSVGSAYYLTGTPGAIGTSAGTFVKNMGTADSTTTLIMTVATAVTPGGSNTQVQFNDNGNLGGDAGLVFIKATDALTVAGPLTSGALSATTGAFSSTVTGGTYNGQTISSAASLTGTLAIAGVTTLTGGLNTPLVVAQGGTGVATQQAYGVLVGGTTTTGAMQSITPGTSGFVLTSAGTGALPTWAVGGTAVNDQDNILATQVFS